MKIMGIDQSINSTGICIDDDSRLQYHLIVPKLTKKQKQLNDLKTNVLLHVYNKTTLDLNLKEICSIIESIILNTRPDLISMENISFGSNGRVIDLAKLVGYILATCDKYNIPHIETPPTTIKKFAVGNGQAKKDIMVDAWATLDSKTASITKDIKNDDLADAYWMSQYAKYIYS